MKPVSEFVAFILDELQLLGPVCIKRMFGGYGLFLDGLMFAIVADDTLYLKADDENRDDFVQQGLPALSYFRQGKECHLSYFQAPDDCVEDRPQLLEWSNKAFAAALRNRS